MREHLNYLLQGLREASQASLRITVDFGAISMYSLYTVYLFMSALILGARGGVVV